MPVRSNVYSDAESNWTLNKEEEEDNIPFKVIQNIQNKLLIKKIQQRIFNIEQCYFNPQILTIEGYRHLRSTPGQHWKSKVYTLFCDTYLPHYWILDIWKSPSHNPDEVPNTVYIQFITFRAKMFVKTTLDHFFSQQNSCINLYD